MSFIYKISCKNETIKDCYIGSTNNFKERIKKHKYSCNNENSNSYNLKLYKFIRDNGGFNNWKFDVIEELKTTDKNEMKKKERYYYELNNSTLNSYIPNGMFNKKIYYYNEKIICPICNYNGTKKTLQRHQKSNKCLKVYNENIIIYFNLIKSL